ncbi:MAG: hypothetical protein H0T72_01525 [Chloroflexia bacterium]|nr:hypothetical protein [Chloroflexia bacterium]
MIGDLVDLVALFIGYLALLALGLGLGCLAFWSVQDRVRARRYRIDR